MIEFKVPDYLKMRELATGIVRLFVYGIIVIGGRRNLDTDSRFGLFQAPRLWWMVQLLCANVTKYFSCLQPVRTHILFIDAF